MLKVYSKFILAIVFISVISGNVWAENGLALMMVDHSARAAGMGNAYVSITDDPNGVVYNPASITSLTKFTASFGHTGYWENIRLESGYMAVNLSARTFLHGGLRFAVIDNLEQRFTPSAEPDNIFDAHDISFKSGLSYHITDKIITGFSIGWFIEKIEAWRGSSFNVDFGLLIKPSENINLGASAVNIGSDFNLTKPGVTGSRDISLPASYTIGVSYKYQKYLGAFDFVVSNDVTHALLGVEAQVHDLFLLRTGYMVNYDSKNFTAGTSFTRRNLTIDYAFVPFKNNLGTSHIFNLTFSL